MVTTLHWSEFVGRMATGRILAGSVRKGDKVVMMKAEGKNVRGEVQSVEVFDKLGRVEAEVAVAGDIVALVGLPNPEIGDTVADADHPVAIDRIKVDEPTLSMCFTINSSPFAGKEGKFVTTRHIRERLRRELESNVALRVEEGSTNDIFNVSGRGLLHLSVLIEQMRREGYELSIGKPQVIRKRIDGEINEPFEILTVDVPTADMGGVMELVCNRRGQLRHMTSNDVGMSQLEFLIPARGLIGLRTRVLNVTKGEAIMNHRFEAYGPVEGEVPHRANGVLVSQENGRVVGFALSKLQERSDLFVAPGDEVYEGMIVGENARDNDMVVNPIKEKKLTNMRASGTDDNIILKPPRLMSLEQALEYIEDDEYVEVTPKAIRLRKIILSEIGRRRGSRARVEVEV
jgi:GTP-binding protein